MMGSRIWHRGGEGEGRGEIGDWEGTGEEGRGDSISLMLSIPCTSTSRTKRLAHLVEVEGGNTQAFNHPGEYPVAMVQLHTGH